MMKSSMFPVAMAIALGAAGPAVAQIGGSGGCGSTTSPQIIDLGGGVVKTIEPDGRYVVTWTYTDPQTGEANTVVVETGVIPLPEAEVNC